MPRFTSVRGPAYTADSMTRYTIDLIIDGPLSEQGHVPLPTFVQQISRFYETLARTDRLLSGRNRKTLLYRVVDLRLASPAVVTVEAQPTSPERDTREHVLSAYMSAVNQIKRTGVAPGWADRDLLEGLQKLAAPVGKAIRSSTVVRNGFRARFDKVLGARIAVILAPEHELRGSIEGRLEAINIHADTNEFRIFPRIGPQRVTCHFPAELKGVAINSIDKFVSVEGSLKYKSEAPFPHAIEVQSMRIIPPKDELPSIHDLRGIAPDATGVLTSEEFVRALREEWE